MKNRSIFISLLVLFGFVYLYVSYNYESFHGGGGLHGGGSRGSGRWGYGGDGGASMYPVSVNCNCPDNYDFIDNNCVNRSYPFEVIQPFCYA